MARVQLVMPDADRDRFVEQARREDMTLSAWLREAARERLESRQRVRRFRTAEDVDAFFERCRALQGEEPEPDWEEHLRVIDEARAHGLPDV